MTESTPVTVATVVGDVTSEINALKSRVAALEADAEADYQKLKAFATKAVAYAKTGGGVGAVAAAGYAAAKFNVLGLVLKVIGL